MTEISSVFARQILDSRGIPTIEAEVRLSCGVIGIASVPSGASTGIFEAKELRDNNSNIYNGKSVYEAVDNVNNVISDALFGKKADKQGLIDNIMVKLDGTTNKSKLGANAILSVSLACARAAALAHNLPLYRYLGGTNSKTMPAPMMNILNGGMHANNNLDFQEFMITPVGVKSFKEALRAGAEIFYTLKNILQRKGYSTAVGDEGGFAPELNTNEQAIELVISAIEQSGYTTDEVKISVDAASSELFKDNKYRLKKENRILSKEQMIVFWENWLNTYPILSIEDGMAQEDYEGWKELNKRIGKNCLLIGDDLFVTNSKRLQIGIEYELANAILIKPNQIGTLTETLNTILLARQNNYKIIISHRSGETDDTFIADLAVAVNSPFIKAGSLSRMERISKYNRLLKIECDNC